MVLAARVVHEALLVPEDLEDPEDLVVLDWNV